MKSEQVSNRFGLASWLQGWGGAVLAGGLLRLFILCQEKSLWGDEFFTLKLAPLSLKDSFWFVIRDVHAPLYYLLQSLWLKLGGTDLWSLRVISVIASVLCIPAAYFSAKRFLDSKAALGTAWMVAISPYYLQMAGEAREYALTALWGIALIGAWAGLAQKTWPLVVLAVLGIYTHHYFWPFLAVLGLVSLLPLCRSFLPPLPKVLAVFALIVALGAPMLPVLFWQMHHSEFVFDASRIAEYASPALLFKKMAGIQMHFMQGYYLAHLSLKDTLTLLKSDIGTAAALISFGVISTALLFGAARLIKEKRVSPALQAAAIVFFALWFLISWKYPIRATARYFASFSFFFFILAAMVLAQGKAFWQRAAFALWITAALVQSFYAVFILKTDPIHREDYKALGLFLSKNTRSHDLVVGAHGLLGYHMEQMHLSMPAEGIDDDEGALKRKLEAGLPQRIWISFYGDKESEKNETYRQTKQALLGSYGYGDSGQVLRFGGEQGFNYLYLFEHGIPANGGGT